MQTRLRVVFGRKRPKCSSRLQFSVGAASKMRCVCCRCAHIKNTRGKKRQEAAQTTNSVCPHSTACMQVGDVAVMVWKLLSVSIYSLLWKSRDLFRWFYFDNNFSRNEDVGEKKGRQTSVTHSCESVSQIRVRKTFSQNQIMGTSSPMTVCIRPLIQMYI